jgi:hypothetical protein
MARNCGGIGIVQRVAHWNVQHCDGVMRLGLFRWWIMMPLFGPHVWIRAILRRLQDDRPTGSNPETHLWEIGAGELCQPTRQSDEKSVVFLSC